MLRKLPLIVILGSTGTGKTKLSLELAERYGGEIISADSMQVYANLDIVTAKATKEEQSRIQHHLLDVATPLEPFTVVHFRNAALPIIEGLLAQKKCPIVVGGTNYYIESLLWDILVSPEISFSCEDATRPTGMSNFLSENEILSMSSEKLHDHLKIIDPDSANRTHPNNKRKIVRAIQCYQDTGETLSSKLKEQRQRPGGNNLGGPLRYPHTILLWLRCNQDVLNARLDKRVDDMLGNGLLQEIRKFYDQYITAASTSSDNSPSKVPSYTRGVLQTIGFKEFMPYLEKFSSENDHQIEAYLRMNSFKMPTEDDFNSHKNVANKNDAEQHEILMGCHAYNTTAPQFPPGLDVLNTCLNQLKLVTRRYSRKQIKWINNRFLGSKTRQVPDIYALNTTDVSKWDKEVYKRATNVIDCYLHGVVCEMAPMQRRTHPADGLSEETSSYCTTCQRYFVGQYQWQLHLKSNKHKKRKEGLWRKEHSKQATMEEITPTNSCN